MDKVFKNNFADAVKSLERMICEHCNIDFALYQKNYNIRLRKYVQIRQIAMYITKQLSDKSLTDIGKEIGGKDHATVLYTVKTVSNLIDTDKTIAAIVANIMTAAIDLHLFAKKNKCLAAWLYPFEIEKLESMGLVVVNADECVCNEVDNFKMILNEISCFYISDGCRLDFATDFNLCRALDLIEIKL